MKNKELKQIQITSLMAKMGYNPVKMENRYFWYHTPYRKETTARFVVDAHKNVWYDELNGKGGDLITLISKIWDEDKSSAKLRLDSIFDPDHKFSLKTALSHNYDDKQPCVFRVDTIGSPSLIQYVESRMIPLEIARLFLKEAHYIIGLSEKRHVALGLRNENCGFALRNKINGKEIKRFTPREFFSEVYRTESKQLNLFEGMFDFLSAVAYSKTLPKHTTFVLNSNENIDDVIPRLPNYELINLYLDNDKIGQETAARLMTLYPNCINRSQEIYPGFKDFSEFLCKDQKL